MNRGEVSPLKSLSRWRVWNAVQGDADAELGIYQLIMIIYVMTQAVFSDGDLALCCDLE